MKKHKITWLNFPGRKGETWNPIVGCSKCSPGCENCYAEAMAKRLKAMGLPQYQEVVDEGGWTGKIGVCGDDVFEKPLGWTKPRTVFMGSMTDMFHEKVSWYNLHHIISSIRYAPEHNFIMLTKRSEDMGCYFVGQEDVLLNLMLGVTCCNQEEADRNIPLLLETPAAKRMVSLEPLLGGVEHDWRGLDWVIVGGESGPKAREMNPDWARDIRDQCKAAGVPYFMKQMSGGAPIPEDLQIHEFPEW